MAATAATAKLTERERLVRHAVWVLNRELTAQDITNAELARRVGVHRSTITRLLDPNGNPTLGSLALAFEAIGLRVHLNPIAIP